MVFGAPRLALRTVELFAGANSSLATNVHLAHWFLLRKTTTLMLRSSLFVQSLCSLTEPFGVRTYLGAFAPAVRPAATEPFAGTNGSLATNVH